MGVRETDSPPLAELVPVLSSRPPEMSWSLHLRMLATGGQKERQEGQEGLGFLQVAKLCLQLLPASVQQRQGTPVSPESPLPWTEVSQATEGRRMPPGWWNHPENTFPRCARTVRKSLKG